MTPEEQAAFESADMYGGNDDDELSNESPESYIEELFGIDPETWEEDMRAVTVVAYRRKIMKGRDIRNTAECMFDKMSEEFTELYGDPEGSGEVGDATKETFVLQLRQLVEEYWNKRKVWQCDPVARREYSAEEVRAILGVTK